jgi:hypothetical protein
MNPNRSPAKEDEEEWVRQNTSPATDVTNPEDDSGENYKTSLKKDDSEKSPGRGFSQKLGEDVDQIDELDKKTLKSYRRKAATHVDRLEKKADQEEDKAMSTDGNRNPDKQDRHSRNAKALFQKSRQRRKGLAMADKRLEK